MFSITMKSHIYFKVHSHQIMCVALRCRVAPHGTASGVNEPARRRIASVTFNVERCDFAADRVGVDGTAIGATVRAAYVADQQVPLLEIRSHDTEPTVVNHSSLLVCQWERVLIKPRHL